MTAKQFGPIILKVLRENRKYTSQDEFYKYLLSKMEDYEEMYSLLVDTGGIITQSSSPAQEKGYTPMIITGSAAPAPLTPSRREEDASARFGAKPTSDMFVEHFTKQEIFDYLQRELPQKIEVQPPGFEKPVQLERRVTTSPGESKEDMRRGGMYMTDVRVAYNIPGRDDPAELITAHAYTTDASLDADAIMKQIVTQANALLRPALNRLAPRFTTPPPAALTVPGPEASREEILASGAFGFAQTDMLGQDGNGMDLESIRAWGLPSAPEAAKKYGG
jgi:hypothetical protein